MIIVKADLLDTITVMSGGGNPPCKRACLLKTFFTVNEGFLHTSEVQANPRKREGEEFPFH